MSLYTIYLKFIAQYLFKYWVVRLTRISVEKMNGIFTFRAMRLCSITLWYHTHTHNKDDTSEEETFRPPIKFFS